MLRVEGDKREKVAIASWIAGLGAKVKVAMFP
jgi:hypothetical protein